MSRIAILGAGAFGTALGISLARDGHDVALVARDADHVAEIQATRANDRRLPGASLPERLRPTLDLPDTAALVLVAVPTQALYACLAPLAAKLADRQVVACNKGIDLTRGLGPTGVIASACPGAKTAILSGPGFAIDIAAGLPTALTIAAPDEALARALQTRLSTANIRLYRSTDVTGVEMGGALKNVIAIAAGIVSGAGLGESARAALMTRGYAELSRFAISRGARAETLAGLSGLGDLILTCTSTKSRNFGHGLALGRGEVPPAGKTVEGIATAEIVSKLARKAGLEVPVTELVGAILAGRIGIDGAREILLSRPLKEE